MAKEDFAAAFLKGLYEGGIGNPVVNEQRRANQLQEQQQMAAKGMVPNVDPVHSKIADHVRSIFYPGSGSSLASAYKPDPNAAPRTLYQDPATNDFSRTETPGALKVPFKNPEDAAKELNTTSERRLKRDELKQQKELALEEGKRKKEIDEGDKYRTYHTKVAEDLDKGWTSRFSNAGRIQGRDSNADAVLQLLNQTGGNPDKRQMVELGNSIQALISTGGAGSEKTTFAMVPETAIGDANKLAEWWINNPRGTEQQAFAKRLGETAVREKELAQDQIKEWKSAILAEHKKFLHPDDYKEFLNQHGIDVKDINPLTGKYTRKIKPQQVFQDSQNKGGLTPQEQDEMDQIRKRNAGKAWAQ